MMLQELIDVLIDRGLIDIEDDEIIVTEDADIRAVIDTGFNNLDEYSAVSVGYSENADLVYIILSSRHRRLPEAVLYEPSMGLR